MLICSLSELKPKSSIESHNLISNFSDPFLKESVFSPSEQTLAKAS